MIPKRAFRTLNLETGKFGPEVSLSDQKAAALCHFRSITDGITCYSNSERVPCRFPEKECPAGGPLSEFTPVETE